MSLEQQREDKTNFKKALVKIIADTNKLVAIIDSTELIVQQHSTLVGGSCSQLQFQSRLCMVA
jgi:cytochrome c556